MDWLKDKIAAVGKKPAHLAKALGLPNSRVYEMMRGDRRLQQNEFGKTAEFLNISKDELVALIDGKRAVAAAPAKLMPPELPDRNTMRKDLPVLGTSVGGDSGDFELNGETIELIRRPERLVGRRAFALYVQGMSMSPWREPGSR